MLWPHLQGSKYVRRTLLRYFNPWSWGYSVISKHQEPTTQWQSIRFQMQRDTNTEITNNNTPNRIVHSLPIDGQVMRWNIHWAVDRDDSEHPTIGGSLYSAEDIAAGACCGTEGNPTEIKLSWLTSYLIWLNSKQTKVYWATSILIIRKPMSKMKMILEMFNCSCLTTQNEWQPKRGSLHLGSVKVSGI